MPFVVCLTDHDLQCLRAIAMDADASAALEFIKNKLLKQVEDSLRKGMDTSKGHL